jgi:hypothetical protein
VGFFGEVEELADKVVGSRRAAESLFEPSHILGDAGDEQLQGACGEYSALKELRRHRRHVRGSGNVRDARKPGRLAADAELNRMANVGASLVEQVAGEAGRG